MLTLSTNAYGRNIEFRLREDQKEIRGGSLPDNAIYLPYKGVSRHHFSLEKTAKGWILRDLDSRNGISLNGEKVSRAVIKPGDTIQVGIIQLHVQSSAEESTPLLIAETKAVKAGDRETDRLGHIPIQGDEYVFSFPELIFPEGMILGKSHLMLEVFRKLHAIAESDVNVLFVGETGAGKEMFAQTLHLSGRRRRGPFIAVNCAAIPTDLAEAELFGIGERVATNVNQRKGKMVVANKGTLFLDELSSFPTNLQSKILRAVETRTVYPVGENDAIHVDFRLMAATNLPPDRLIKEGKLREDLYHRLATVEIHIPPLRERKGDVETLIMGLLQQLSQKEKKNISGISRRLFARLLNYSYPGNVRELVNILASMVALAHPGEVLDLHLLPEKLLEQPADTLESELEKSSLNLHETLDSVTRKMVLRALKLNQGNITRAAQHLQVSPFGLRKMMKRLQIHFERDTADQ